MQSKKNLNIFRALKTARALPAIGALLIIGILGGGAFVYFGVYNVAASTGHSAPAYYLLHYAMKRSVRIRARNIVVPNLTNIDRRQNGLKIFRDHCVECHGAPGVSPGAIAIGMVPAPSNLVAAGRDWPAADLYWVVKHGVKMTAMPAWEYKLSDSQLWDVIALIKWLPELSPDTYRRSNVAVSISNRSDGTLEKNDARKGNAKKGRAAVAQYMCGTCHRIPGIPGEGNAVGPSLAGIANRRYIGGVLLNTPENMALWLRDPQAVDAQSAMPDLGLTKQAARDIAKFLGSLR